MLIRAIFRFDWLLNFDINCIMFCILISFNNILVIYLILMINWFYIWNFCFRKIIDRCDIYELAFFDYLLLSFMSESFLKRALYHFNIILNILIQHLINNFTIIATVAILSLLVGTLLIFRANLYLHHFINWNTVNIDNSSKIISPSIHMMINNEWRNVLKQ